MDKKKLVALIVSAVVVVGGLALKVAFDIDLEAVVCGASQLK